MDLETQLKAILGDNFPRDGIERLNAPHAVTPNTARLLYDFVRTVKPARTLEVGLAYGISTLCICQAHRDNGAGAGSHIAIDPYQEESFKGAGLANIERANLKDMLRFYQARSDEVLPELCARRERVDFAFIDGNHHFDYALVDFFFIDKMLNVGGHVAFDDLWMRAVRSVVSFVLKNTSYKLVRASPAHSPSVKRRLLMLGHRISQNPLGRDWTLKLVPQNVAILRKLGDERLGWGQHRAF
jgi:predicted O-methyltransferase YrrM